MIKSGISKTTASNDSLCTDSIQIYSYSLPPVDSNSAQYHQVLHHKPLTYSSYDSISLSTANTSSYDGRTYFHHSVCLIDLLFYACLCLLFCLVIYSSLEMVIWSLIGFVWSLCFLIEYLWTRFIFFCRVLYGRLIFRV